MPENRKKSLPKFVGLIVLRKEVNALLHKLLKLLACFGPGPRGQQQFDGQLLDENREDVYALMQQQMSSLR